MYILKALVAGPEAVNAPRADIAATSTKLTLFDLLQVEHRKMPCTDSSINTDKRAIFVVELFLYLRFLDVGSGGGIFIVFSSMSSLHFSRVTLSNDIPPAASGFSSSKRKVIQKENIFTVNE